MDVVVSIVINYIWCVCISFIHRESEYSRNRVFCLSFFLSLSLCKHCFICTNYIRKLSGFSGPPEPLKGEGLVGKVIKVESLSRALAVNISAERWEGAKPQDPYSDSLIKQGVGSG